MILVVCISNGGYEKQQSVNLMYISMERMSLVFLMFSILKVIHKQPNLSLNWQHEAIVEYVMLKLAMCLLQK